jgi:hypothetical protein
VVFASLRPPVTFGLTLRVMFELSTAALRPSLAFALASSATRLRARLRWRSMLLRRRGLLLRLLHLLVPLLLPGLLHHLPSLNLLWCTSLWTLFMTWLRLRRSLFALNLLRNLYPLHFSLRLLLCAPRYSLTLCLLSLLLSLRLLQCTLRALLVDLLRSLLPLKLAYLPPRILVTLRRLGSKLCHSLSACGVLLVARRIHLDRSLVPATSVISLPFIS